MFVFSITVRQDSLMDTGLGKFLVRLTNAINELTCGGDLLMVQELKLVSVLQEFMPEDL